MNERVIVKTRRKSAVPRSLVLCLLAALIGAASLVYAHFSHIQFIKRRVAEAKAQMRADRPQDAEATLKSVLANDPDNPAALEALAKVYIGTQRIGEAVDPLRRLVKERPNTPGVYANLAECLRLTHDPHGALQVAEEGVRRNPNDVSSLAAAARLLKTMDEGARELEYERRMVQVRPEDPPALKMLGAALVRYGFYQESLPILDKLAGLSPDDPTVWTLRGQAMYHTDSSENGLKQAESFLLKALEFNPDSYVPNLILGRVYVRMKQPLKAIPCLLRADERVPTRKDADFVLAQAYDLSGQRSLADAARKRFVEWRRTTEEARQLEKRVALSPDSFDDNLELGSLKLNRGDLRDAQFYLARAAQIRPGNAAAQSALQRLKTLVDSGVQDQQVAQDGE